jgi:hypothetical protein
LGGSSGPEGGPGCRARGRRGPHQPSPRALRCAFVPASWLSDSRRPARPEGPARRNGYPATAKTQSCKTKFFTGGRVARPRFGSNGPCDRSRIPRLLAQPSFGARRQGLRCRSLNARPRAGMTVDDVCGMDTLPFCTAMVTLCLRSKNCVFEAREGGCQDARISNEGCAPYSGAC